YLRCLANLFSYLRGRGNVCIADTSLEQTAPKFVMPLNDHRARKCSGVFDSNTRSWPIGCVATKAAKRNTGRTRMACTRSIKDRWPLRARLPEMIASFWTLKSGLRACDDLAGLRFPCTPETLSSSIPLRQVRAP